MKTRWGRGARAFAWALVGLLTLGVPGSGLTLAAEQGSALTVASDPVGAAVYVDGKLQGQTPLSLASVAAGDHRVKVVKDGYLENSRLVNVRTGQAGALNVHLTPGSSNLRMQVDDQPSTPAAPRGEAKKGGGGKKIAFIALGAAVVGGGILLAMPKNKPPVVSGVTPTPATALMAVTSVSFTASGASDPDGDPLTYKWDFGDGQTGTGATATHVYSSAGSYTPSVEVSDGKKSAKATGAVTVRSLAGAWDGGSLAANLPFTLQLNQSGTTVSGSYSDWAGSGTVSGTVSSPRHVRFTTTQAAGRYATWEGDLGPDLNTIDGLYAFYSTTPTYGFSARR